MRLGTGATVSVLSRFLHPSNFIRDAFPNPERGHRLEDLIVLRKEKKIINRKEQTAVVVRTEHVANGAELYVVL